MNDEYEHWETVTLADLLDDGRFEEAERALASVPADDPDGPWAMSLRALCLVPLKREAEALALAEHAVEADRTSPFGWWTLGSLLRDRNRFDRALAAARQALALDPTDARVHGLIAHIHALRGEWTACREAAERGLALDPADETCSGLRALSLRATEDGAVWSAAMDELIERYPASSFARMGKAWSLLESGDAREATQQFEQALALDPTSDAAREGLIESIKARNPVYARLLRLFLWLDRLPAGTRWGYILGGLFAYRLLRNLTESYPAMAPLTYPLMALWVLFVATSWTAVPLTDFVLSRSHVGRRLVHGERLLAAQLIAGLLGTAVLAAVVGMVTGAERALGLAFAAAFLVIPVSGAFRCERGWPRTVMMAYASVAAAAVVAVVIAPTDVSRNAAGIAVLLSVLGSWLAVFLASRTPAR